MTALVRIVEDRAVADSRDVAVEFGKQHQHLLRAIDSMIKTSPDLASNFGRKIYSVSTAKGASRDCRRFDMDRKGFMLLVMGFTGAKALEKKSQWIDAFDAMEAQLQALTAPQNDNDEETGLLPPLHEATRIAALGEAYRRIYGARAAQWIMQRYGMPVPAGMVLQVESAVGAVPFISNASEWLAQCCKPAEAGRESASGLYASYVEWCAERQQVPETQTGFGRALSRHGFAAVKANNGRVVRIGLELVH